MKKRIASVLVALVMVLSLVPKTSWAWTSTVTTLEQLKSAMSELSYNNTIEIVVSGTIEISETLNIRPTRTTNGSMAWYEYYNQRVVISGADANSKLVRAEGFKGSLFNLTGEQGYSGAGGSDHPAYAALTLKDITVDGGGDKTTATNPAIYVSRYGTLTLEDGAVLRNCKSQYYAGGAVGLFAGTSELVMNGTARMEDNEADYGGGVYVANILAAFTMNGGTIANNTARKYGGGVYCEANKQYGSNDTAKINLNGGTITGNTAGIAGGGVYFGGMTTCKVAGTVNITGNTQGDDKAASNLHVAASAEDQAVLAGNVSSDSRIGLNADLIPAYRIVRGSSDTNVFTSDRANCAVMKNGSVSFNLDLLANEEHTHCVCLQNQSYGPYHDHDKNTKWVGISSLKSVKSYGCYYLLNDVTATDEGWGSNLDDVRICLNGHNIILENGYYRPYIHVTNYHTLTITDCAEEAGQITCKDTADPKGACIVEIDAGCKFNMFGGEITGLDSSENSAPYPAAVFNRGTFNLCGGKITGNKSHAVYNENATMNLYGGEISGNTANGGGGVAIIGSTMVMNGGTISNNSTYKTSGQGSYGAGVYVADYANASGGDILFTPTPASFEMNGGKITGNTALDYGGGVLTFPQQNQKITININNGEISGNKVTNGSGGTVAAFFGVTELNIKGGTLTGNSAYQFGGGVFLYQATNVTIFGGMISENKALRGGGGVCLREGSAVKQTGGSIENNVAKVGGGIYSGTYTMTGGVIKDNNNSLTEAARLSTLGDGVFVGTAFNLGNDAEISTNNDVYLTAGDSISKEGRYINVISPYTGASTAKPIQIHSEDRTVENTEIGTQLVRYTTDAGGDTAAAKADANGIFVPSWKMSKGLVIGQSKAAGKMDWMTYVPSIKIQYQWVSTDNPSDVTPPADDYIRTGTAYTAKAQEATHENYTFAGWFTDAACTLSYTDGTVLNTDTILCGKWDKIATPPSSGGGGGSHGTKYYILHYESNGGTKYEDEKYKKTQL